jgi:hypothetical protein
VTRPGYIDTGFADSFGAWETPQQPPDRFVLDVDRSKLVGYWAGLGVRPPTGVDIFPSFPPGTHHVAGISLDSDGRRFAWNLGCPICDGPWAQSRKVRRRGMLDDPLVDRAALKSPESARRWIFELLSAFERHGTWREFDAVETWSALAARDADFLQRVLQLALNDDTISEILLIDDEYDPGSCRTVTFSPAGVQVTDEGDLGPEIQRLWSQDGWYIEESEEASLAP